MKSSKSQAARRKARADLRNKAEVCMPKDYPWQILRSFADDLSYALPEADRHRLCSIIRARDFGRYLQLSEDWGAQSTTPGGIGHGSHFQARYQLASLLKKFQFPGDSKNRRAAALKKFYQAEEQCREFNDTGWMEVESPPTKELRRTINIVRWFLRSVLGDALPDADELTRWSRHGPGSNLDTMDGRTSLYHKYRDWPYSCTEASLGHARSAIEADERWLGALEDSYRDRNEIDKSLILNREVFWSSVLQPVKGNRIAFVPKNSLTDRSIAIEPSMNLWLQLGVDGFIRKRLKRYGVNLDDQTKNQRLAYLGSKFWMCQDSYVTLDLAAASDTVSQVLCWQLLPKAWYDYLMDLRSPFGSVDDGVISYEKISSMGNGYTFALESLIFAAVCYAATKITRGKVTHEDFATFGDDLIVRKSAASLTIQTLNLFGFSINTEKSFLQGPFRESCGADFLRGKPVRPVFLTETPTTVMGVWCDHNRIRRFLSLRVLEEESITCDLLRKWVPVYFESFTGPCSDEQFDSYLHTSVKPKQRHGMYRWKALTLSARSRSGNEFLFRKLMHSLREHEMPNHIQFSHQKWRGIKVDKGMNAFKVSDNRHVDFGVTPTQASIWPEQYNEHSLYFGS